MPHVTMKEILKDAMDRKYAIPNLWGGSMEMVLGQVKAAEELGAPISICYCKGQYPDMPLENTVRLIVSYAEKATVPIMTFLDHATDFETCVKAIRHGISSVMYDGSYLSYEENVRNTQEVVKAAHSAGVSVEAELGAVGGSAVDWGKAGEFQSVKTDPDAVVDFVGKTGIDSLAVSFGNRHGLYKGKADLDWDLLRRIRSKTDIPLVMHGASDLPDEAYPRIVEGGISKIHFWSGPSKLAVENLKDRICGAQADEDPVGYQDVFAWNVDFFYRITKKYLALMNADGKY
ncbi:MAG: class II fructose-bisphosphate aldolase [Clostridiales bacterium]|nr:class II fructose-bisphosphate aldolase [Clostridiales bacterium]